MSGKTFWAYSDETGDRGLGANASPIFGMATVLGDAQAMTELREAIGTLRTDFKVQDGTVMSWKKHLKTAERRLHAVKTLANLSRHRVVYAVSKKTELADGSFQSDEKRFYDFVSSAAYKGTLWAARNMGADEVRIRFGRVKGVDHDHTRDYIRKANDPDSKVPTGMEKELSWVGADQHYESEAADFYAGFLKTAFWPDDYGNTDHILLQRVWHQVRKGPNQCAVPLGMFTMPHYGVVLGADWFWCQGCPAKKKYDQEREALANLGIWNG